MLFTTKLDISIKGDITRIIFHYFPEIKVDSYDSLPIEKTLTSHVIILIKPVLNKDKNHYY